jgi:hypothetical protein
MVRIDTGWKTFYRSASGFSCKLVAVSCFEFEYPRTVLELVMMVEHIQLTIPNQKRKLRLSSASLIPLHLTRPKLYNQGRVLIGTYDPFARQQKPGNSS